MKNFILCIVFIASAASAPVAEAQAKPELQEVTGTVLFCHPWNFFIIDTGKSKFRVTTDQGYPELEIGDTVTARGVFGIREGRTALESAKYEKLDRLKVEVPCMDTTPENLADLYKANKIEYGTRIRITARLLDATKTNWGSWDFHLDVPGCTVMGWHKNSFPKEVEEAADMHPLVEVVGTVALNEETPRDSATLQLCVQSLSDIRLVPDPEFTHRMAMKRLRHLWLILPVLVVALILLLLVKFIGARREKLRLAAIVDERKRMAADLHDTIEQHLAGAAMFLDSVLPIDGSPTPEELKPVETARNILMTAKREIRETVWNLHVSELVSQPPEIVLRRLAVRAAESGTARIRALFRGLPKRLSESVFSDLIFIVQEAMANAMKHGHAKNISIVTDPTKDGFRIRVANDGEPFDVSAALIPEAGHFGLSGLLERARRSGMKIAFESDKRHTVVSLEVNT